MVSTAVSFTVKAAPPSGAASSPAIGKKEAACAGDDGAAETSFSETLSTTSHAATDRAGAGAEVSAKSAKRPGTEDTDGDTLPPADGNFLPLPMLLPPNPPAATVADLTARAPDTAATPLTAQTANAVTTELVPSLEGESLPESGRAPAAADAAVERSPAIAALQLLKSAAASAAEDGEATPLGKLVAEAVHENLSLRKAADAAAKVPAPDAAKIIQQLHGKAGETANANAIAPAAGNMAPTTSGAPSAGSVDDAALRRLLASMPGDRMQDAIPQASGFARDVSAANIDAKPAQSSILDAPIAQLASGSAAASAFAAAVGKGAGFDTGMLPQMLKDASFERVPDAGSLQAPGPGALHGIAAQQPQSAVLTATNGTPTLQLQTPLNHPEWADGVGDHIVWMTDQNLSNAQIKLNPAHLGPIEVQISMADDQTNVWVTAHHGATREALEAAAPKLRDLLSSHGLGNVNVNVNHQSANERQASQTQRFESWRTYPSAELGEPTSTVAKSSTPIGVNRALLDAYA